MHPYTPFIIASIIATVLASTTHADPLQATGSVNVPGPGSLDYTVSATKVPGTINYLQFSILLFNSEDFPITIIACAMIRLDKPDIEMPQFTASKDTGTWVCSADGTIERPPGFHFGCRSITVPAAGNDGTPGKAFAFNDLAKLAQPFNQADLEAVYWDVLEDCPIAANCSVFNRPDVNLTPESGEIIENSANIWGGNWWTPECLEPLEDNCTQTASSDVGNWFTMRFPGTYASTMTGAISGAPALTQLTMALPNQAPISLVVPTDDSLNISQSLSIPPDPNATMSLTVDTPVPEGTVIQLQADVFADANSKLYETGQLMHGFALEFRQDTIAPTISSVRIESDGSGLVNFEVDTLDEGSHPGAASLSLHPSEGELELVPLSIREPRALPPEENVVFVGEGGPFAVGYAVSYDLTVVDLLGNTTTRNGELIVGASDFDGDGLANDSDNCVDVSNPAQRDTDDDGLGNLCDADFNQDCRVDFIDLGFMKSVFFSGDPDADLNGDGTVNFVDLGITKAGFFTPPGPSGLRNICEN